MIKALISDFSRVLLFPKHRDYTGGLNDLYRHHKTEAHFNFFHHFELNEELFAFLLPLNKIDKYILTTEEIQNDPAIRSKIRGLFRHVFSAKEMGLSKTDPAIYTMVLQTIQLAPADVLYIDDLEVNVNAARQAALPAIQYKSVPQLKAEIQPYLT